IPFIESKLMTPIYLDRYTIGACPALALLVATGLNTINWRWSIQVLAVIVILSGSGLYGYLKSDSNFGENWRKPVQEIEAQSQQNDVILFYPSQFQVPFDYYYKGNLTEKGVDSIASANKFIDSKDGQAIGHSRRLWLDMARNDPQIYDLFVSTYGNNSIKSSHWYPGNRLILFDP
ncbi:MAG TPA: hypothetical protein VEG28_00790, partial [Dehalococcoidia bacterium]|nr:hypothetical protein [Dehalococcoidia bacterium]